MRSIIDVRDFAGTLYPDVRKRAAISSYEGIVVTPVVGSSVIVSRIGESDEMFVEMFSEVETIYWKIGEQTLKMDKDSIVCNGGALGGMVILEKLEANLDALKKYVEAIHQALPGAFTAIGIKDLADGGAGSISYTTSMTGKAINFQAMENSKIKQ